MIGKAALAGASGLLALALAAPAGAAQVTQAARAAHPAAAPTAKTADTGPVSPVPASGTPQLAATGTTEQVRQLVQCGGTMYAVGSFTEVSQRGTPFARDNIFSFSATAPFKMTSWDPGVNGTVNSIAFNGADCSDAYIGGDFTSAGGSAVKNIAEIDTTTGAVLPTFQNKINKEVDTLAAVPGHLLVGGKFTVVNNGTADPYMASVSLVTGRDDGFLHLNISGNYQYQGAGQNGTRVFNQQISHGGTLDLVEGDFTSAGGQPRQQIFMVNLATNPATVTGWTSPEWDGSQGNLPWGYAYQCTGKEPFYLQAAAWSADDSTVYVASTGYQPWNWSARDQRTGLCDSVAAFPATQAPVTHQWINYTGCDSLYSVAADASAVYVGGHERWSQNPDGCNNAGPGAISDPGMEVLSPSSGADMVNGSGTGLYVRGRGLGADDMMVTTAGLWIASDNAQGTAMCGGAFAHSGICFLPYP